MELFKEKTYYGLDISESAIKLVEIYKTHEGYRLKRGRLVELDIDPLFDDSAKRAAVTQQRLKQLLAEERIASGNIAIALPGQSVFIRPLNVPKIAKNKIEQILQYEAQLQVPFPINEVIWNYELFDSYDSPEIEATLVAVKKDIVEERLKLLSGTGLDVEFVELDSFSIFNFLQFIDGAQDRIVLDIGAKTTEILIAGEQKLWTRSILLGGHDLTKAIAAEFKISFKEAEDLKRREGILVLSERDKGSSPRAEAISNAITPVMVEFLADVSKSIGYYKSQFGETKVIKEILITGGTSRLRNIVPFIRGNIDIPAKVVNLMDKVKGDIDFGITENMTGRMDVAVGLALRTVTPLTTKTNLLPKEILQAREFKKKKWYIFGSLTMVMLIFFTLTGFMNALNRSKTATLAKANALIERYTKFHNDMDALQSDINDLKARLDVIAKMTEGRMRTIRIFSELLRMLPDNLWLTELLQDGNILTLRGRTRGTFDNINNFKDTLIKSGHFKSVDVESANVLKDESAGGDIRGFMIKLELQPLSGALTQEGHDT